jgi:hypothetical protein
MEEIAVALPASFLDDVTGYKPQREIELTARLAVLHHRRGIHWDRVPLYRPTYERSEYFADSLFADDGVMVCEYPMFCQLKNESIWGDMKADLLYFSKDRRTAVLVENKIGSNFTSGGNDVETGQLARQIEYLNEARVEHPVFVLLSARALFEAKWYWSELMATIKHKTHCARVRAHLMTWEDIFRATAP